MKMGSTVHEREEDAAYGEAFVRPNRSVDFALKTIGLAVHARSVCAKGCISLRGNKESKFSFAGTKERVKAQGLKGPRPSQVEETVQTGRPHPAQARDGTWGSGKRIAEVAPRNV
jgi:hypothetical protein